jgi:4-hydroxy-tetrahydrodipicolinate reductase
MGQAVAQALAADPAFTLKACVDRDGNTARAPGVWIDSPSEVLTRGDVAIEFSSPDGCREAAVLCGARGAALVSGTTGLSAEDESRVREAARTVPVLRASNFSMGVLALRRAVAAALAAVPGWDVEIVERHHRRKADSPSGTALTIAREVAAARGWSDAALRFGREGRVGERPVDEVGIHAVRGGSWVGDHAVLLAGAGEWLELRHVAQDRAAFAHGALAAARFVATAPPGLYTLDNVQPLRPSKPAARIP